MTFARNCFHISARLVLNTLEIVDLCVIKCVESAKIWCVRKLDVPLSMDDAVELIFIHSFGFFMKNKRYFYVTLFFKKIGYYLSIKWEHDQL